MHVVRHTKGSWVVCQYQTSSVLQLKKIKFLLDFFKKEHTISLFKFCCECKVSLCFMKTVTFLKQHVVL